MHRVLTALAVTIAFVASAATSTSAASERSLGNVAVNVLRSDLSGADLRLQPPPNDARSSENSPLDETTSIWSSGGILWAVPTGTDCVIVTTTAIGWRSVAREEIPDSVWESTLADPLPLVRVSSVMILREMPLISLAFNPLQPTEDGSTLRRCEDVAVELHYSGAARSPDTRRLSAEFYALARPMVENLDEVSPEPEAKPESYLIITNPTYTTQLTTFVNWKRARGHTVTVRTTAQTGSTNQQIRTFLQTAYNTWAEPPVYVLLVGDVDNPSPLASWLVPGSYHPLIASDHPYALLDGEDYLPDVFVGRFSIDQGSEAQTVVNKCIAYERDPHQPQGDWRRRMMIVGVRSTPGYYQTYNSAWPTLQWIGRQFTEVAGYNQICTVPFPGSSSGTISQWINSGVSFVAYRGFGSPSDWTYPSYTVSDVQTLSNGAMLPVVASIVCGGGAFESTVDPCFGEAWLRAGSPSQPKGAIGFIGPSELDTKTRWNNTIVAGIYEGILFEDVPTLSAAMLRGKLELIRQFPNNVDVMEADADRSVSFYFHCYNLLGDPGLTFYVGDVRSLSATLPPSLPLGAPSLTLTINHASGPLAGAWGTVVRSDTAFSRAVSDSNGRLTLRLPQDVGGPLQVTVTKPRFATVQSALTLGTATSSVGSHSTTLCDDGHCGSNGNGDGRANPGEALSLGMVVRNYGTASFGGGWLNLAAVSGPLTVITSQQSLPVLSPQAQSDTLWFVVPVIPGANDGTIGRLEWSVTPGGFVWQTETEIYAPRLLASAVRTNGIEGNPPPLSSPEVSIQLANHGRTEQPAFTATLRSQEGRVIVLDSIAQYAAIPAGASTWPVAGGFTIAVGSFYPGDRANTVISSASPSRTEPISFALPIGNLTGDDPTHPDDYGYRAFQSGDTAYSEAPPYAWVEIRPSLGGSGTILSLPDTDDGRDTTRTISLPFGFRFYGHLYQQISVCSNGFIAFGPTTESYFRNYALPAIASPDKMVCVFWDDLMVPPTGAICTYHDANSGRFIIEWSGLRNQYGLGQPESFQLMLFDTACWATRTGDGELLMQYKEFSNVDAWDNYSTVGIQDRDLGHALQITYAGHNEPGVSTIRSQQSILFTTGRPDSLAYLSFAGNFADDDQEGGSHGNGDGIAQNGETVELSIRLRNTGRTASPSVPATVRSLDPLATLLDSTTVIPPIAPGGIGLSEPFIAYLSGTTPNGHVVNFLMQLDAEVTPCVVLPSLAVSSPFLVVLPPFLDDDATPPSNGNGNGELNPNETVELTVRSTNFGDHAAAGVRATLRSTDGRSTVLDSTAYIGEIPGDSTRSGDAPLVVRVNPGVGAGQRVAFLIAVRDTFGNEMTLSHTYTVVWPSLTAGGVRVNDSPPYGDGDGRLQPGESGMLYPRVRNEGSGTATNVTVRFSIEDSSITLSDSVAMIGTIPPGASQEPFQGVVIVVDEQGTEPRTACMVLNIAADGGIQVQAEAYLVIGDVLFFDDFETDLNYWSVFGTAGLWILQSWDQHSPRHAFYCGQSGTRRYPPGADAYLRSPTFSFSGSGTLLFHTRYRLFPPADVATVQLQTGPTTYHLLAQFTGFSTGWEERRYSLAGLPASESARVRFRFVSDWMDQDEGWYVDDVIVVDHEASVDEQDGIALPTVCELEATCPNPFNDRALIRYRIAKPGLVRLTLYDIQGRQVAKLMEENKEPGSYQLAWHPIGLASGIYLIELQAGGSHLVGKVVYLK